MYDCAKKTKVSIDKKEVGNKFSNITVKPVSVCVCVCIYIYIRLFITKTEYSKD